MKCLFDYNRQVHYLAVIVLTRLQAQDRASACYTIEAALVVDWYVLLRNDFDDFLSNHAASQSSDVVKFRRACPDTVLLLARTTAYSP